jgi:hypothetical protein
MEAIRGDAAKPGDRQGFTIAATLAQLACWSSWQTSV